MAQRKGKQEDYGFGVPVVTTGPPGKNKKALHTLGDVGKGKKPTLVKRVIRKITNLK